MHATAYNRVITLSNGVELPRIGLGTFRSQGAEVKLATRCALQNGIKHIDTAAIYKNEAEIAEALDESGVQRKDVFITSKISPYQQGKDKAPQAVEDILYRLKTDYVDLLLVHWPGAARTDAKSEKNAQLRLETWQVLEQYYRKGHARAIGISNFEEHHLQHLLNHASIPPAVNQFECHPRRPCHALRSACAAAHIAVVAYASLGCGDLLSNRVVQGVAAGVGKTPAQVLLRWGLQQDCAVIPKSVHPEYIAQYSEERLLSWQLAPSDMALLDSLADGHKYCWDASDIV
eukprot:jgi/Chrzof1/860/Cz01g31200.t1